MSAKTATKTAGDSRSAILDAAQSRLITYGYHKTTMAEIADDVGMSAANLYRYFANKEEIAAECATRCLNERLERLRAIVDDLELSAAGKLTAYALELVDDSHALAGADSKIGELVATITENRPALLHEKMDVHHELLGRILEQGRRQGDFEFTDLEHRARCFYNALMLFDVPLFVGLLDRPEFENRARGVVDLLLNGLLRR